VLTERKCVYQQFPYTQIALLQCDHNKDWEDTHLLRSLFSCAENFKMSRSDTLFYFLGNFGLGKIVWRCCWCPILCRRMRPKLEKREGNLKKFEENICQLHIRGSIVATSVCCVICCGLYSSNVLQPSSNRSVGTAEEKDWAQVGAGCGYSDIIELYRAETGKARGSSSWRDVWQRGQTGTRTDNPVTMETLSPHSFTFKMRKGHERDVFTVGGRTHVISKHRNLDHLVLSIPDSSCPDLSV